MSAIPTPNVDSAICDRDGEEMVPADFARTLERECHILRSLLAEKCFHACDEYFQSKGKVGYTLDTDFNSAYRDIVYRDAKLYETPEAAVSAAVAQEMEGGV